MLIPKMLMYYNMMAVYKKVIPDVCVVYSHVRFCISVKFYMYYLFSYDSV